MTTRTLLATSLALLLAACGSGAASSSTGHVAIQADLSGMGVPPSKVVVNARQAQLLSELTYDAATGHYFGAMTLPAGLQDLDVEALDDVDADGQLEVVAAGSTQAMILANQTASVVVTLVDTTPPPPVPDHAPIIVAIGANNRFPSPGEAVSVWVGAVDVDEDPLSYQWAATCDAGAPLFGDTTADFTTFTATAPATCTLTVTVSANGKLVTGELTLFAGGSGSASLEIGFTSIPVVNKVVVTDTAGGFACAIDRAGTEGTCPGGLPVGAAAEVVLTLDAVSDGAMTTVDACGTALTLVDAGPGMARFAWPVAQDPGACVVSASLQRNGRTDLFPIALLLQ